MNALPMTRRSLLLALPLSLAVAGIGCTSVVAEQQSTEPAGQPAETQQAKESKQMEIATFGGGCFWCVEAVFERVKGVSDVVSGYEGGHVEFPTYEQVCGKRTGHIEVCQIHFDPEVVSFDQLLEIFFKTHDPTSWDAQGADIGPQYRSVVFYHNDAQEKATKEHIQRLEQSGEFGNAKIVTEVRKTETFYRAEDYHQDYFENNPYGGYCQAVVRPKVEKAEKEFADKLKPAGEEGGR